MQAMQSSDESHEMIESSNTKPTFPDSRMPTELERQQLCRMLYYALLEIRVSYYSYENRMRMKR